MCQGELDVGPKIYEKLLNDLKDVMTNVNNPVEKQCFPPCQRITIKVIIILVVKQ